MTVAAVLLAAGLSRRFGDDDKIAAPLEGRPLGRHAADRLVALGLTANYVVVGASRLYWPGFETVRTRRPEAGIGLSVAIGVAAARRGGATAVLIALADMPFVPIDHLRRLLARHDDPESLVATGDGKRRMPPALFGSAWFEALERLDGDRGASGLLERAEIVPLSPAALTDIDRPEDLAAARGRGARSFSATARPAVVSPRVADPRGPKRR